MSEFQHAGAGRLLGPSNFVAPGRIVAAFAKGLALLAALGVVFMTLATVYDVFVRYVLNAPTSWATEISTYVLISTIFLGAAYTHLTEGNVRVRVVLDRLTPE